MNRKRLTKFWAVVWILFALSHVLIPIAYFGTDELKQLTAIMSWGCFGLFPVLVISCLSPIFTLTLWEQLDVKTRRYGLLYPGLIVLASLVSMFILEVIFWVIGQQF